MPEIPSHKVCNLCKALKEKSEFHPRRYRGRKGQFCETLRSYCKDCSLKDKKEYRATDRGKMLEKISAGRYCSTDHGKRTRAKHASLYRKRNRLKDCIRSRLKYAIRHGKLIRPKVCSQCLQESKRITAHHHKGYAPEFALDVIWLCVPCHVKAELHHSNR